MIFNKNYHQPVKAWWFAGLLGVFVGTDGVESAGFFVVGSWSIAHCLALSARPSTPSRIARCWVGFAQLDFGWFRGPSTRTWDPFMGSFPEYSHTTPIRIPCHHSHVRIPKDMGIVWETYQFQGVPCPWGSLKIPLSAWFRRTGSLGGSSQGSSGWLAYGEYISPPRIGLWDPFQMGFLYLLWLIGWWFKYVLFSPLFGEDSHFD